MLPAIALAGAGNDQQPGKPDTAQGSMLNLLRSDAGDAQGSRPLQATRLTSEPSALVRLASDAGDAQASRLTGADAIAVPDWPERYAAAHPYGLEADVPDWPERYAAAHPYGQDTANTSPSPSALTGIRSDAGDATASRLQPVAATRSASAQVTQSAETAQSGGFHWGDAGIGALLGAVALALLGGSTLALFAHRRSATI